MARPHFHALLHRPQLQSTMVIHIDELGRSPDSVTMSTDIFKPKSMTMSSLPRKRGHIQSSFRLPGIKAHLLILLVSAAMVFIFTCSTHTYAITYTEQEWLPNRRVVHFDVNASFTSINHDLVTDPIPKRKVDNPLPRIVFSSGEHFKAVQGRRIRSRYDLGSLRKRRIQGRPSWSLPTNTTFCVPMKSWQTTSFPTCNTMHEISLTNESEEQARILGTGGWRATWRVDNSRGETIAFKTLK